MGTRQGFSIENFIAQCPVYRLVANKTRLSSAHLDRRTLDNIRAAGLQIESEENLTMAGMFKFTSEGNSE